MMLKTIIKNEKLEIGLECWGAKMALLLSTQLLTYYFTAFTLSNIISLVIIEWMKIINIFNELSKFEIQMYN